MVSIDLGMIRSQLIATQKKFKAFKFVRCDKQCIACILNACECNVSRLSILTDAIRSLWGTESDEPNRRWQTW